MRWTLVMAGLGLQMAAVVMYLAARRHSRTLDPGASANLAERSLLKPPFLYLAASGVSWGTGVLLISVFALIDSDPVLLLSQVFLAVIGSLILLRFKI